MKQFLSILLFSLMANASFGQTLLTLDQALARALDYNLNIQVAQNTREIAANNNTKGNAGLLPSVNTTASYSNSVNNANLVFAGNNPPIERNGAQTQNLAASLSVGYTLFNGFKATSTLQKLQGQDELANIQMQVQIESILNQVVAAYYQVLSIQENRNITLNNLAISQKRYERAKLRVEYGSANRIDMLNAEVDLQNDSINLITLNQNFDNALARINYLLGSNELYELEATVVVDENLDKAVLTNEAMSQNYSLLQLKKQMEVSLADIQIAKSASMPILSANAGLSYSYNKSDASLVVQNTQSGVNAGLNFSYSIFNGGRSKTNLENSKILSENYAIQSNDLKNNLALQLSNAFTVYRNNLEIASLRKQSLQVNKLNFERSEELYSNGQINGIQFREAQLNLSNAELNLKQALINAKLAEMELVRLSGNLVKI